MRLTALAAVARRTGFPVVEEAGWLYRGVDFRGPVRAIVLHHDAARHAANKFNTVIRDGRAGLSGPLSQFALRRDGTIHVVAGGRANHAGVTINDSIWGGDFSIGIEAGNDGVGEPWPRVQLDAYEALVAELGREYGLDPMTRVRGHKEIAYPLGRKIDPAGINMDAFRVAVKRQMSGGGGSTPPAPKPTPKEDDSMQLSLKDASDRPKVDGMTFEVTPSSAVWTRAWLNVVSLKGDHNVRLEFLGDDGVLNDSVWVFENDKALVEGNHQPIIPVPKYCRGVRVTYSLKRVGTDSMNNCLVLSVQGRNS